MKHLKTTLLITFSLMLVGCGNAQYSMSEGIEPPEDHYEQEADRVADDFMKGVKPMTPEEEEEYERELEKKKMSLPGTWTRTAIYSGGQLVGGDVSTLAFAEDGTYYSQTDLCTTSGTYELLGHQQMKLVMLQSGCPSSASPPFTVTNSYSIEKNEDEVVILTIVTGPVTETYVRY